MSGNIVVLLDGSPLAERALPYAETLARVFSARLVLVRSADLAAVPALDSPTARKGRVLDAGGYLRDVAYELSERAAPSQHEVIEPPSIDKDPADWILEQVRELGADIVVMATSGRSGVDWWIYGSVADRVLAGSFVPVLLVRDYEQEPPPLAQGARLLVPLDGSELAEAALPMAEELAAVLAGELVLLRSVSPPVRSYGRIRMGVDGEYERLKAEARRYLESVADRLSLEPEKVRLDVRGGDPTESLICAGREHEVALVVMTTRGRTGVSRTLMGSVADGAVRRGKAPALLLRAMDERY